MDPPPPPRIYPTKIKMKGKGRKTGRNVQRPERNETTKCRGRSIPSKLAAHGNEGANNGQATGKCINGALEFWCKTAACRDSELLVAFVWDACCASVKQRKGGRDPHVAGRGSSMSALQRRYVSSLDRTRSVFETRRIRQALECFQLFHVFVRLHVLDSTGGLSSFVVARQSLDHREW